MIVYAGALKGHHSVNLEAAMLYARRRMQGFNDPQRMCRIRKYNEDLPVLFSIPCTLSCFLFAFSIQCGFSIHTRCVRSNETELVLTKVL